MLNQLRRHAKGWMTKGILGAMAIGLIFYFGYAGVRKATRSSAGGGKKNVAAVVNGEPIPLGKFEQAYDGQIQFYQQITKGQIPPPLQEQIREGVLQKLIQTKLFAQQAKAIGLSVSDKELLQEITSNQNFIKDGMFNKKLYLEQLPSYQEQIGQDFESAIREELLADKFENLIRNSVAFSNGELKQEFLLSNTQLNLQKIIHHLVDPGILDSLSHGHDSKPSQSVFRNRQISNLWIALPQRFKLGVETHNGKQDLLFRGARKNRLVYGIFPMGHPGDV